ncbi:MAG: transposase [Sedimenticola sp.]
MKSVKHVTESLNSKPAVRRRWGAADKAVVVRRHLRDKVSVADLADEYNVAPGQISQWCKQALEGIESIFKGETKKIEAQHQKELLHKENKINQLQEVVCELSTEVLQLKKPNGV